VPTIMLRHIPPDLMARLAAYASAKGLGKRDAALQLLTVALDHLAHRAAGAAVVNHGRTPEERSAAARVAVTARWARQRGPSG
jgi:hypothetical protein